MNPKRPIDFLIPQKIMYFYFFQSLLLSLLLLKALKECYNKFYFISKCTGRWRPYFCESLQLGPEKC